MYLILHIHIKITVEMFSCALTLDKIEEHMLSNNYQPDLPVIIKSDKLI